MAVWLMVPGKGQTWTDAGSEVLTSRGTADKDDCGSSTVVSFCVMVEV